MNSQWIRLTNGTLLNLATISTLRAEHSDVFVDYQLFGKNGYSISDSNFADWIRAGMPLDHNYTVCHNANVFDVSAWSTRSGRYA